MRMPIRVKRVYEKPAKTDGSRVLVDRLWPRGVTKAEARITYWAKDIAPSNELRRWFHEDPEHRFKDFEKQYVSELKKKRAHIKSDIEPYKNSFTLVTAVKDIEHSHIPTLRSFLGRFL